MADKEQLLRLLENVKEWNKWRKKNRDINIDLSRASLSHTDLSGASLSHTDLSGADLSATNLSGANLIDANLSSANLSSTNLSVVTLIDATLIDANLSKANLNGVNLGKANLSKANLSDANLSDANLSDADLRGSKLNGVNLSSADLLNAELYDADLRNAKFSGAKLMGTRLIRADLRNADLRNADLRGAYLTDADLRGADLRDVHFIQTQALDTNFEGATLTGACIKNWNTNSKTNLNRVICEYIYLNYKYKNHKYIYTNRRPHDPNRIFVPGEFSRRFQIVQDSLSLYFKDDVDWQAAAYSFQSIATDGTPLDIEGINRTKDGGIIITVNVPENADKGKLEEYFWRGYQEAHKTFERERQVKDALIANQKEQIESERQDKKEQKGTINQLLTIVRTSKPMITYRGDHIENSQIGATRPTLSDNAKVAHTLNEAQQQDLASAAKEIQDLLNQLSETYPTTTLSEKSAVAEKAIDRIKSDENWLGKVVRIIKAMGKEAFFEAIDHPAANVLRAGFEELLSD